MSQTAPAILILEDTRTVQNYIRDVLSPLEAGHPILMARKLADAQQLTLKSSIGLFIVDIGLPDGDGIDFLCEMSVVQPDSRALIITASPTDHVRERARQLGVLNFMAKPLERKPLLTAARRLLNGTAEPGGATGGFEGTLRDLSPIDIIQLKCLRGATGAIELREGQFCGQIWLERGDVIHAECRMPGASIAGPDAFRIIVNWTKGAIRDAENQSPVPRTIFAPWQQLLLEAEAAARASIDEG